MNKRRGIVMMVILTALAVAGMQVYDSVTTPKAVMVETVTLKRKTVAETVVCTGTVTASDGVNVYASVPCIAGDIAVDVGDRVEKGDVLLTIDRTATLALAVQAGVSNADSVMVSGALPQTVTAPDSGVVSAICAAPGETLDTQTPCVVIAGGDGVAVSIAVRERSLPLVAIGQDVAISGVAFDKELYRGTVSDIASSARTRANGETVVDVTVSLCEGEADESLLIGLTAKAAVTVATREAVLVVPYDCLVQNEQGDAWVYRVENGVAHRVAITVTQSLSDGVLIEEGLQDGDELVCAPDHLQGDAAMVITEEAA